MKRMASLLIVLCAAAPAFAGDAFDRLKALEGSWKGMAGGGDATVTYHVTGAGSAVVETLFPGTEHEMVTVYHKDGDDVVLTHYCAGQNQPRMRAKKPADGTKLAFTFDGGTNIAPEKTMHMHEATIEFKGADEVQMVWTPWAEGKPSEAMVFDMKRVK